jgi:autoinducer 2 (AI-2) kinase
VGAVDKRTAELTGLPVGAIVAMGGGDTECGVLGLGARKAGDAAVITGSSAPVECVVDMPVMDREFRTLTNPFLVPSRWVVESNAMLTGASYGWIVSTLCDSKTEADRMRDYEALDREISATEPGAEGALCYLGSSIMDSRRGSFSATAGILAPMRAVTGLALTRGHLARAAMEAEAYAIRANVEQLRAVAGVPIGAILAGGGSLRSAAFRFILPDVLGIPVLASDDEATMRGCAMCAAAGAGLYGDIEGACAAMAQRTLELAPDAARRGMYESPYRRWIEGFERMRGLSLD